MKELIMENGIVSDKTSIANTLNHYFTNIVEQISEGNDYSDEYDDSKLRSFVLPVSVPILHSQYQRSR